MVLVLVITDQQRSSFWSSSDEATLCNSGNLYDSSIQDESDGRLEAGRTEPAGRRRGWSCLFQLDPINLTNHKTYSVMLICSSFIPLRKQAHCISEWGRLL